MPEDTKAVETPAETQDTESEIRVGPKTLTMIETTVKKGPKKGDARYYIKVDLTKDNPFADIIEAVGKENWNRTVMALVRSACDDATHDATNDKGQLTDEDWAKQFIEQFISAGRRSTTGVKQLREKHAAILADLQPLMMKQAHGEKLAPEENTRLLQLLADFGDLSEKIEKKSRKGKKGEAAEAKK